MTMSSDVQVHRYYIDNLCLSKMIDLKRLKFDSLSIFRDNKMMNIYILLIYLKSI